MVAEMLVAASIIVIIIVGSGSRMYFRKKFGVTEHFEAIDAALRQQTKAKGKLHNVQNR